VLKRGKGGGERVCFFHGKGERKEKTFFLLGRGRKKGKKGGGGGKRKQKDSTTWSLPGGEGRGTGFSVGLGRGGGKGGGGALFRGFFAALKKKKGNCLVFGGQKNVSMVVRDQKGEKKGNEGEH